MQKIRFTYKSSEVHPSVFLLLFFRMTGIYVYERFFDSGRERREHLLSCLPKMKETSLFDADMGFDLDLFFIADEFDSKDYIREYEHDEHSPRRIIIIPCGHEESVLYEEMNYYEVCSWTIGREQKLLSNIISKMATMNIITPDTYKDLKYCQSIYQKHQIWILSLLGKYFYVAEDEKQYNDIKTRYHNATSDIFNILSKKYCMWGDNKYIHLQYAGLNMAYEGDLYCMRNNKTLFYDPRSLVYVCKLLLTDGKNLNDLKDSLYLLLAQMYDDLLKDSNLAYKYYLAACKNYNAYVYYRKANYWQEIAKDYRQAIKYYMKSVNIYPEYYRAWYMLGFCYMLMGRCDDALEVFRNIDRILEPRLSTKKIRPMEIEYLFKAQNQCAYICKKVLNNPQQSIRENFKAVEVWEAIDQSEFFDFFKPDQAIVRQRVKNQLNVSKIYYEIYLLAARIGDVQLKQEYMDKIINI